MFIKLIAIISLMLCLASNSAKAGVYDDILMAAQQGDTDTVVGLLRRGMDVNTSDPQGNTLLMIAARTNNLTLMGFLLDNRANSGRRNRFGDTAMMLAALQGYDKAVELMLERKVDPNHAGWNPLHYAAFEGRANIVSLLLAAGADINARAPNGWTPLMLAAQRGQLEIVRLLIGAGADFTVSDPDRGNARELARIGNHDDTVRFLDRVQGQ